MGIYNFCLWVFGALIVNHSARLFLFVTVINVMLLSVACVWAERYQILDNDEVSTQVASELPLVADVWKILIEDYGGRQKIDRMRIKEGAIQGMADELSKGERGRLDEFDYNLNTPGLDVVLEAWNAFSAELQGMGVATSNIDLEEAAVKGMLNALENPYTVYLSPEEYQREVRGLSASFEGIGVYVHMIDNKLTVISPMEGMPAQRAGISAGDIILQVDGMPIASMTINEAVTRIRGPRGTPVELMIKHSDGREDELVVVIRGVIKQKTVRWVSVGENLAYLRISRFLDETDEDVYQALQEIEERNFDGLIIDVRRNPGGLVDTTVRVVSYFLEDGIVFYQIDGHDDRIDYPVLPGGIVYDVPLVVLVDGGSASASEILAASLQARGDTTVIGDRTFGKGSVNEIRALHDGSGLYFASALWYTPEGLMIEGEGVTPDIIISMDLRTPLMSVFDQQLSNAVEHLESRISPLVQ